jgi:NAD(P)-dependent dehydrogenase (short-subunit alcohol dehydrogenase family)
VTDGSRVDGPLRGCRVLVVGASAGIGRVAAIAALRQGAEVVLVGRSEEKLRAAVVDGGGGHAIVADVSAPGDCTRLVDEAAGVLGKIDLVLHCAAVSQLGMVAEAGADNWRHVLDTNVVGPALVVAAALERMSPHGIVAVLSSETVGMPHHGLVPYGASKAAVEELVRGFRVEHPEARFCCIRVGATEGTEFARDFSPELGAELFPAWVARAALPARMMSVTDLGRALVELLGVGLRHPGIDLQDLTVRAPGGPYAGDTGFLLDLVAEAAEANG